MGTDTCHADATCTNTEGSFTCECKEGFTGTGYSCSVDVAMKYGGTIGAGVGIGGGGAVIVVGIIIVLLFVLRAKASNNQIQPDNAAKKYTAAAVDSMAKQHAVAAPTRIAPMMSLKKVKSTRLAREEPEPESSSESEPEPKAAVTGIVSEQSIEAAPGVNLALGSRVKANGYQEGTIRYIGDLKGVALTGIKYVGIELDEPEGSGDGTISGHTYFKCAEFHALFTTVQFVEPLE